MKIDVKTPSYNDLLKKFHLEPGGKVQAVIDLDTIRFADPYVPMDSGFLSKFGPEGATVVGSGEVVYPGPYAHYQYYGEVYGPNFPFEIDGAGNVIQWRSPKKKYPTGRKLKYKTHKHPLAGPFWIDRMKADRMNDILEDVKRAASK